MKSVDVLSKKFFARNDVFAESINTLLFGGRHVVREDSLTPIKSVEAAVWKDKRGRTRVKEKTRDVIKEAVMMTDGKAAYRIRIAIEAQSPYSTIMPLRNMLYDALDLCGQVNDLHLRHDELKEKPADDAEFLSGFYAGDKLIPVITTVVYLSPDKWKGPTTLYEMFGDNLGEEMKPFVQDYKIHILSPYNLPDYEVSTEWTPLNELMYAIKYMNDKDKMESLFQETAFSRVDWQTAVLINEVTSIELKLRNRNGVVNMCPAIQAIRNESHAAGMIAGMATGRAEGRAEGIAAGRAEGIVTGRSEGVVSTLYSFVRDRIITMEEAAVRANMSLEDFQQRVQMLAL